MSQPSVISQVSPALRQLQAENEELRLYLEAQKKVIVSLERRVGRSLASLGVHVNQMVAVSDQHETWQSCVQSVQDEVSSLCDLLSDTMLLQKLEAGKVEVQLECLPLVPLLSSVSRHLLDEKNDNRNRLICEFAAASAIAWIDRELLEAVLTDLLARGLRYSDGDSPVVLGIQAVDRQVQIYVTAQRFAPIGNADFATEIVLCCRRIEVQNGKVTCQQQADGLQTVTLTFEAVS